jgi:hypothetical protein
MEVKGWAFRLPKNFGSGISGFRKFGFSEMISKVCPKKQLLDISVPGIRVHVSGKSQTTRLQHI